MKLLLEKPVWAAASLHMIAVTGMLFYQPWSERPAPLGAAWFSRLESHYHLTPRGIDNNEERADLLKESGFNMAEGDAVDSDFCNKLLLCNHQVQLIMLAMPSHAGNLYAIERLRGRSFHGRIAAAVKYNDEIEPLKEAGADAVMHIYEEAETGLIEHVFEYLPVMQPTFV